MTWTIASPDGALTLTVTMAGGRLSYAVERAGTPVLGSSALGLETDRGSLAAELTFVAASEVTDIDEPYRLPHGKRRELHSRGRELVLEFHSAHGETLEVALRAHDDGAAFRYRSPKVVPGPVRITGESSEFAFASEGRAWALPQQHEGGAVPAYENAYVDGVPLGSATTFPAWLFPALFQSGDHWVLLTESDADSTFSLGSLRPDPDGRTYGLALPLPWEGLGVGDAEPVNDGPWQTPWRVAMIADDLAGIFESDLVRDLASATSMPDMSWIDPGLVAWSWWSDHDSPQDPDKLEASIDFAAEMGWGNVLIDANWNLIPEARFDEVLAHARANDVGVFLWYNSGGPNNEVTEQPRDRMYDADVRRAEMRRLADLGIKGLKVDFFHSDKQVGVQLLLGIISDAAEVGLLVNIHGCTAPRGWDRTWPHLMTMEAVRGAEQYFFKGEYPDEAPWHNVVLAFTRNVVGPMDYTPITFSDSRYPHLTTNTHELALGVVFESGLQHPADSAASYRRQSDAVRGLLARLPAVWDESRLLDGFPGDFIVVARRLGDTWYIAGINGRDAARDVAVDVGSLGVSGPGLLFTDDGARSIADSSVSVGSPLEVSMAPFGGFVLEAGP